MDIFRQQIQAQFEQIFQFVAECEERSRKGLESTEQEIWETIRKRFIAEAITVAATMVYSQMSADAASQG